MTKTTLYSRWALIVGSVLSILLLALLIGTPVGQTEAAPAATTYAIAWYTADNGGGVSNGGSYQIAGTTGQMDTASGATGADYSLNGGFWPAWMDRLFEVFLPTVIK